MPVVDSDYHPPRPLRSGHLQTIYPVLFRKVPPVPYRRRRIETPDGDFLDLDLLQAGHDRAVILSHGLEGNTERTYMRGMARALHRRGWDVVAWNYRGCSGEPNRLLRSYHSGATEDLEVVVEHVRGAGYPRLALVGFSLGANLTFKYLGERAEALRPFVVGAVGFSAPFDLAAGAARIAHPVNRLYMRRFLKSLHGKVRDKAALLPGEIEAAGFRSIRTFRDFDGRYTAPLHGFASAEDYWAKASSGPFVRRIRVPTLAVSAADDPLLPVAACPFEAARRNPWFTLEVPRWGGHVGFLAFDGSGEFWSEQRAAAFLEEAARRPRD